MSDETVTTCAGCGAHRYCREYKGLYLCLSGAWHCWKHRETILAKHNEEAEEDNRDG